MIYTYNKETLTYKKLNLTKISLLLLVSVSLIISSFVLASKPDVQYVTERHIYTEKDTLVLGDFDQATFVAYMKDLNIKFPHIVYAQALVETGHFSSDIFLMNNNLFGMKRARIRCNTARGTQKGHAYYEHWTESVVDYALYQNAYLYNIRTEEQYFDYLAKNYAEDPNYVSKLRKIINEQDVRSYIDNV